MNSVKNIFIYANCQGEMISYILKTIPAINDLYTIDFVFNWILIEEKKDVPLEKIKDADVFIYQPLAEKYGIYSPVNMLHYLKKDCIPISFPYIYNAALWPFYLDDKCISDDVLSLHGIRLFDYGIIAAYVKNGVDDSELLDLYKKHKIDFMFNRRFQYTMKILRQHEEDATVRVADFIEKNIRKVRLFYTCNHPAPIILNHCVNQILDVLGVKNHSLDYGSDAKCLHDETVWPITKQVQESLGLEYFDKDADMFFIKLLTDVLRFNKYGK
ncbi:MAG: WcbI family polysaccharide biosynthesis putative acetyltransferase [Candidatus Omnitrophica bacterium]|nr:WcbI family polysaccharide biosynthesis putative acetyltransferase [Candidatus Omnitrophota bacterium]